MGKWNWRFHVKRVFNLLHSIINLYFQGYCTLSRLNWSFRPKSNFIWNGKPFCFCSAAWRWIVPLLLTWEIANQHVQKALFSCVVYILKLFILWSWATIFPSSVYLSVCIHQPFWEGGAACWRGMPPYLTRGSTLRGSLYTVCCA